MRRDACARSPGVGALLDAVRADERLTLALLTGNIEPGARLKLGAIALNDYFPFGAFGSDSPRREELPPIAVERAAAIDRPSTSAARTSSSSATRSTTSAAAFRTARRRSPSPRGRLRGKLRAENPDHFFDSAEELDGILVAIKAF